jgi:hypothetical protein
MSLYPIEDIINYIYTNAKRTSQLFMFERTIFEGNKYNAFLSYVSHYFPVNVHNDIKPALCNELLSICTRMCGLDRSTTFEKYVDIIIRTVLRPFQPLIRDNKNIIIWSDEVEKLTEENRRLKEQNKMLTEEIAITIAINKKRSNN